jgi:hypothetical protein
MPCCVLLSTEQNLFAELPCVKMSVDFRVLQFRLFEAIVFKKPRHFEKRSSQRISRDQKASQISDESD